MRLSQSRHCSRHSGREVTRDTRLRVGREVHVTGGTSRGGLAVIDRLNRAVPHPNHHEAAASDVPRFGVNNSERETDRYGGINGVSSLLQDLFPHLARNRTAGDDQGL